MVWEERCYYPFYQYLVLVAVLVLFLMVVVYRLPRQESLGGRSHCEHCGKVLTPWQLDPYLVIFILKRQVQELFGTD